MNSKWFKTTISDQAPLQRGFDITQKTANPGNVPVISSSGISYYTDNPILSGPGVVIGRKGTLGTVFYVASDYWPSDTTLWVTDFKGNNPKFVYYFYKTLSVMMLNLDVGSANPTLNRNHLHSREILWTDRQSQDRIAEILSGLDDKIELNRQMNRTLEQMARALFKSWFIDFDPVHAKQRGEQPAGMDAETAALFPDRFVEIDGKEVPEGWEITSIGELAESIFSGGTPDTRKPEYWNGAISWFSSGETRNSFIIKTEKTITPAGVENSSTRPIRKKDILVASAGQGFTRGQTSFNVIDAYINQSVVAIRTKLKKVSPEWLYMNISGRYEEMRGLSDGHSSRGSLTTKIIALMPVALAPQKIIGVYTELVEGLIERQVNNMREIDQLASLRDSLLPRLLSGELDVSDWENAVEDPEGAPA